MSKDMLGPLPRALVQVPNRHHGLVLDILHKLAGGQGDSVRSNLSAALRAPSEPVRQQAPPVVPITDVPAEYRAFFEALPPLDRQWVLENPRTAVPLFARAVATAHIESYPLVLVGTADFAEISEFRPAEKYQPGQQIDGILISPQMHKSFKELCQTVEHNTPAATLRFHSSNTKAKASRILSSFGDKADTTLGQLWELIQREEKDDLLQASLHTTIYMCFRKADGNRCYVSASYAPDGWYFRVRFGETGYHGRPPNKVDRFITH
ncbi:MAG: hypothetical protein AB202_02085 [Parcubacteria bacterium C7867-007]|nr:MAG: hypothetical protein AB202_02085 [Parcubacteria bacterium C7867-007]